MASYDGHHAERGYGIHPVVADCIGEAHPGWRAKRGWKVVPVASRPAHGPNLCVQATGFEGRT